MDVIADIFEHSLGNTENDPAKEALSQRFVMWKCTVSTSVVVNKNAAHSGAHTTQFDK